MNNYRVVLQCAVDYRDMVAEGLSSREAFASQELDSAVVLYDSFLQLVPEASGFDLKGWEKNLSLQVQVCL